MITYKQNNRRFRALAFFYVFCQLSQVDSELRATMPSMIIIILLFPINVIIKLSDCADSFLLVQVAVTELGVVVLSFASKSE